MRRVCLAIIAMTVLVPGTVYVTTAASQDRNSTTNVDPKNDRTTARPKWNVGDKWVVETASRSLQATDSKRAIATRWEFSVAGREKIANDAVLRIDIRCLDDKVRQPGSSLWVNVKNGSLRQIKTQIPVPGGFRTITESYSFADGNASPVMGPLTVLPVDLPVFQQNRSKGLYDFEYEAISGAGGAKALGDVGFAFSVQQKIVKADVERSKGLTHKSLAASLSNEPSVEVEIRRFDRTVRQLWRGELPWPVFSSNGSTESRLIKVVRNDRSSSN